MEHELVIGGVSSQNEKIGALGPILCWAVVFANIGSSIYYVPGILSGTTDGLAGFFVLLIMPVFLLLALKYTEVTDRFPDGGGAVTVAAQAINHWVGALAGMLLLVGYFSTAAISCLSSVHYLSLVVPAINQPFEILYISIGILILLGFFNWTADVKGIAKVALIGSVIAFVSDVGIIITVFTHISFSDFFSLLLSYKKQVFTPFSILIGVSTAFLAIAGLESISQLSPDLKSPRRKVIRVAILLIVLTIALTSPLLTMLSTLILPEAAIDPHLSTQLISLLGGHWGNLALQVEVAMSASAILIIAGNTAIVGTDRVFVALSRREFLPFFVLRRNRLRGTRHYSVALATGVPIAVLLLVKGNINILGEMYAFGLLGAFTLTCLGLDIVRHRERKEARAVANHLPLPVEDHEHAGVTTPYGDVLSSSIPVPTTLNGENVGSNATETLPRGGIEPDEVVALASAYCRGRKGLRALWYNIDFWLGVLTTILVLTAWSTNLIYKPLATAFGGTVVSLGMTVAYINYARYKRMGRLPVVTTDVEGPLPGSILAVLTADDDHNTAILRTTVKYADESSPTVFLYVGPRAPQREPSMFEFIDPYREDLFAQKCFSEAERLAKGAKIQGKYIYKQEESDIIMRVWQTIHPRHTVIAPENAGLFKDALSVNIVHEVTPDGEVAHALN